MASNFLDRTEVPVEETPFADNTPADWAVTYIVAYGSIDGDHHKAWVLDQVARILKGTPVIVERAEWGPSEQYPDGHKEWVYSLGEPSQEYLEMVKQAKNDPETDDPEGYEWSVGIAP